MDKLYSFESQFSATTIVVFPTIHHGVKTLNTAITVLIVDDHEVVRKGLRAYFDTIPEINVIGEAGSGEEAIAFVKSKKTDVVLMDLIMPGMDGVEATRQIKLFSPQINVVILTSFFDDAHIFPALKAGATSYILKDVTMEKLVQTIQRAIQGEIVLHPRVTERVLHSIRGDDPDPHQRLAYLTDREHEVLQLIANGFNNSQIAEKLIISENTVKGYVGNILSKLNFSDRTQVAVFAWQHGLVKQN